MAKAKTNAEFTLQSSVSLDEDDFFKVFMNALVSEVIQEKLLEIEGPSTESCTN